jgi:hypothetical protein
MNAQKPFPVKEKSVKERDMRSKRNGKIGGALVALVDSWR